MRAVRATFQPGEVFRVPVHGILRTVTLRVMEISTMHGQDGHRVYTVLLTDHEPPKRRWWQSR